MRPPKKPSDTDRPAPQSAPRPANRTGSSRPPRPPRESDDGESRPRRAAKAPPEGATNRAARRFAARADAPAETKRSDRTRPGRPERAATSDRSRPDRPRSDRPQRPDGPARPPRPDRPERPERSIRTDRPERSTRTDRPERSTRTDRPVRPARAGMPGRPGFALHSRPEAAAADAAANPGRRNNPATRPARPAPRRPDTRPEDTPRDRTPARAAAPRPPESVEPQRVARLLARAGVASRRDIEKMITEGRIALHGEVITTPATIVSGLMGITVNGLTIDSIEPSRIFRFHKPAGVLTTARDPGGRPTIFDVLPPGLPRLVPVGRLDMNTEGLLLLTTDGGLKRSLELPSSGVPRAYRVRAYGEIHQRTLESLIDGLTIEGTVYGPIDAGIERRTGRNLWISMMLTEGKNREIRRVLEFLGLQVSRLIRISYGPIELGDLAPREVDEVPAQLVGQLMNQLKRGGANA